MDGLYTILMQRPFVLVRSQTACELRSEYSLTILIITTVFLSLFRDVMHKFTVDLPKKHGRGGQSALRFARLRMEKRHNYVRKVAETAVQLFISNDKPNISGMILAGSADFKTELSQSDMFDPRLQGKIIKLVDVSYGGNFLVLSKKPTEN